MDVKEEGFFFLILTRMPRMTWQVPDSARKLPRTEAVAVPTFSSPLKSLSSNSRPSWQRLSIADNGSIWWQMKAQTGLLAPCAGEWKQVLVRSLAGQSFSYILLMSGLCNWRWVGWWEENQVPNDGPLLSLTSLHCITCRWFWFWSLVASTGAVKATVAACCSVCSSTISPLCAWASCKAFRVGRTRPCNELLSLKSHDSSLPTPWCLAGFVFHWLQDRYVCAELFLWMFWVVQSSYPNVCWCQTFCTIK